MALYSLASDFRQHRDSVNALAFSPKGRFLASGGDDCVVFVLDPHDGRECHKLRSRIAVTALEWDSSQTEPYRLFIGYASGEVVIATVTADCFSGMRLPRDSSQPIEHLLVVDAPSLRLIVCAGADVEVWTETSSNYSWSMNHLHLPRTIISQQESHRVQSRSAHTDGSALIVSYLDHGIFCWDLNTRIFQWHLPPRTARIGRSSATPDCKLLIVSNLYDGFDLYNLETRRCVRTYKTDVHQNVPLPALITRSTADIELITGSSNGRVCVYRGSGPEGTVETLDHDDDIVQALACSDTDEGFRIVATGPSEKGDATTVRIWKRLIDKAVYASDSIPFEPQTLRGLVDARPEPQVVTCASNSLPFGPQPLRDLDARPEPPVILPTSLAPVYPLEEKTTPSNSPQVETGIASLRGRMIDATSILVRSSLDRVTRCLTPTQQKVVLCSVAVLTVSVCTYGLESTGTSGHAAWALALRLLVKLSVVSIRFVILILQWYIDLVGGDQVAEKVTHYLALTTGE